MRIKAALYNADHLEYGLVTIPFPIPQDQYNDTIKMLEALDILLALSGRRLLEVSRNPPCKLSFLLQRGEDWIDSYAVMIVRQGYEREASLLLNQLAPETTLLLRLDDLGQHGALTVRQSCYFVVRQAGKLRFYKGGEARH